MKRLLFLLIFVFSVLPVFPVSVSYEPQYNVNENLTLPLRNYGIFAPAGISLYAIGLYVEGSETDNMKLKDADEPMVIQLVSLSNLLGMGRLTKELRRGFEYGVSHDEKILKEIRPRINEFLKILNDSGKKPRKNARFTFVYVPGDGTSLYFNSEFWGKIPGLDFKQALSGIWLNSNCANDNLREQLVRIKK